MPGSQGELSGLTDEALWLLGREQFEQGSYFLCHETLEILWRRQENDGASKTFTQGIIQMAVAYYHFERGNAKGASKLFEAACQRFKSLVGEDLDYLCLVTLLEKNLDLLKMGEAPMAASISHLNPPPLGKS